MSNASNPHQTGPKRATSARQLAPYILVSLLTVGVVGVVTFEFPALFGAALAFTEKGPVVVEATTVSSPDGMWEATLEVVDNGMGFGLGLLLYEVHVHARGTNIPKHGDREPSSAFYLVDDDGTDPPLIRWLGDRKLSIDYMTHESIPGKSVDRIGDVAIEYRRVDRAEGSHQK
jgi:hypothetical protein